jgi:GNAT superfamily N-acetyltransferase
MTRLLEVKVTLDNISRLQDFHCGEMPYELPLASWIKTKAPALLKDKSTRTRIWDYELSGGVIVGYGSLNIGWIKGDIEEWSGLERIKIQTLPTMAVHADHKGKGYSHEILNFLEAQAIARLKNPDLETVKPLLGLAVNPKQTVAFSVYKKHGFREFNYPLQCPYTGDILQYMTKRLQV